MGVFFWNTMYVSVSSVSVLKPRCLVKFRDKMRRDFTTKDLDVMGRYKMQAGMRGTGKVSRTRVRGFLCRAKVRVTCNVRGFLCGEKVWVTMLRNWPGVCWPNDCGGNGYVSSHGVLCITDCLFTLHIVCSSDASSSRQLSSPFLVIGPLVQVFEAHLCICQSWILRW